MKVAYVSGPYRSKLGPDGIFDNIYRAREIAKSLWRMGYAVICPHTNTMFMDGAAPDTVWVEGDLELLRRCDLVVMTPFWEGSTGAVKERELAIRLNIPVFVFPGDTHDILAFQN